MKMCKLGFLILLILELTWSVHGNVSPLLSSQRNDQNGADPPPDRTKNITVVKAGFMGSKSPVQVTYKFLKTIGGKTIHSFLGMPYGEDPSGEKRFKKVGPFPPLGDKENPSYDASEYPKKCPQMNGTVYDSTSAENCLFLNVYTNRMPDTNTNGTIPVMVYIHGGSFVSGDASQYKPDVLLDYNVILVTIQYRLGSLGFFTRLDSNSTGNVGLWDQITALQWVQNNIEFLGGNKSHVTIFGHGTGAASVNYLLILNGTSAVNMDGLFHAAIVEGGSALDVWALDTKPINSSRQIATANNCSNMTTVFQCMMNVSAANLTINLHKFIQTERANGRMGFSSVAPVVQSNYGVPKTAILLTDKPDNLIRNKSHVMDIPVILGANKHEGSYSLGVIYRDFLKDKVKDADYMRNKFLADVLNSTGVADSSNVVADLIKYDYVEDKDLANLTTASPGIIDLTGALYIKKGVWKAAEILAASTDRKEKVFFYSFDFESKDSLFDTYFPSQSSPLPFDHGVTSGDELMYLFSKANQTTFDDNQNKTRDRLAILWTNFASTWDPTPGSHSKNWKNLGIPKWKDVDTDKYYLLIEQECTVQEEYAKRRHIAFDEAYPPKQPEEYQSLKRQRRVFLAFMIIFLTSTVGLLVTGAYLYYKNQ